MVDEKRVSYSDDFAADLAAFQAVASAFNSLDHDGRQRLLRTIATFYKLEWSATRSVFSPSEPHVSLSQSPLNAPVAFSEDRTPSPKDFLRDKKPVTDGDRVAVLAYYLTHYRGVPHFKTVDLSQLNTEAAQVKFSNAAQAVDNATKAGLLVPAVKGAKQLSSHGELYVQALPDRDAARATLKEARPRRKKRSVVRNSSGDSEQ